MEITIFTGKISWTKLCFLHGYGHSLDECNLPDQLQDNHPLRIWDFLGWPWSTEPVDLPWIFRSFPYSPIGINLRNCVLLEIWSGSSGSFGTIPFDPIVTKTRFLKSNIGYFFPVYLLIFWVLKKDFEGVACTYLNLFGLQWAQETSND